MIFGPFFIVDCSDSKLVAAAAVAAAVLPPLQMSLLQLEALSRLNSRRSIIPGKTLFLHEVYRSRKEMWMLSRMLYHCVIWFIVHSALEKLAACVN